MLRGQIYLVLQVRKTVVISAALRRKGDMGKRAARDLTTESEVWPAVSEEH